MYDRDPLGTERAHGRRWAADHDAERLLWRLVYLFESEPGDTPSARRRAARVVRCLATTGSPTLAFELLPLVLDAERLQVIVARHRAGIISRTGFLSVLAESGYPPHAKLWLEHAGDVALAELAALIEADAWGAVGATLERAPRRA